MCATVFSQKTCITRPRPAEVTWAGPKPSILTLNPHPPAVCLVSLRLCRWEARSHAHPAVSLVSLRRWGTRSASILASLPSLCGSSPGTAWRARWEPSLHVRDPLTFFPPCLSCSRQQSRRLGARMPAAAMPRASPLAVANPSRPVTPFSCTGGLEVQHLRHIMLKGQEVDREELSGAPLMAGLCWQPAGASGLHLQTTANSS